MSLRAALLAHAKEGKFNLPEIEDWLAGAPLEEINQGDEAGNTLLHYAAYHDCDEVVARLLRSGADPHQPNALGNTAFNEAAPRAPKSGRLMTMHWFEHACKGEGPGLNDLSGSHHSPLIQYAAKWCSADELKTMLNTVINPHGVSEKINPFVVNASGWTPLHAAACMPGRDAVVQVLAETYANAADETKRQFIFAKTTEAYPAEYPYPQETAHVNYPAGATAWDLVHCRRAQDQYLSQSDKMSLRNSLLHIFNCERRVDPKIGIF